ncbi:MAG: carboxy terminal-processing peptidase [Bdellovibrionales bacterium]|nr:carboxy terminal-processing peptidase [Bdellovibrionales bacterium]
MNFIKQVSLLIVLPLIVGTAHAQNFALGGPMQSMKLTCNNVKDIQRGFLLAHVIYNELTPTLEAHTVDRYIDYLDGSKIIFTKGDVETIQKEMKGIFTDLEKRDCKKLQAVQKLYSKRLEDRAAFAKATLNKDFKFDKKTRLVIDAKKRSYSANDKELKELQKKYLNFQVSNYLLSDEKLPDAVEKVKRSYDRIAKKLKDIKEEDMLTNYLNAFGRGLDAHTSYFSADMLEDFEISMRLSLQGIGATLTQEDGFTTVEALVKGGAADRSGLVLEKDKIIGVSQVDENGKVSPMDEVIEWDLRDVVAKIRGNKGTKVRLKIMRKKDGKPETLFVTLTRDEVKLEDEAAQISYLEKNVNGVNRKVGVINLPSFYADSRRGGRSCAEDVAKLIEEAKKQKVDSMVLDLSQNGGGSLSDAVDLAGLFFGTGNVVMQSSRSPEVKPLPLKDVEPKVNWSGPLVILTSRFSASASEIVAGALKDYGRAVVVGSDHTFGKGTVQQVIQLATGLGALKVTIGMFFTPSGFSTQHRGVASHIVFPSEFDGDDDEIGEKTLEYSLPPKQIDSFLSPQAYVTTGEGKWDKVDDKVVSTLKKRSEERVASSPEFAEIKKKVEKRKKDTKEIVLEDSFNDLKEKKDESDKKKKFSEAEKKAEYFKRADVSEAVNIAVDFVDIKSKVPLKVIAQSSNTASDNRGIQSEKKPVQHEN